MRHALKLLTLPLALLLPLTACSSLGVGGSDDVVEDPDVAYERARELFQAEQWEEAEDVFGAIWRDHPNSEFAADARFYEAESRYGDGNYRGSFELYKRYLQRYPHSAHSPLIQRRIYDLGVYTIEEGQRGLWGVFEYADEGVAMLDFLVSAFPNGDLADDALVYAADFEMKDEKPLRAIGHLHDLIEFYPGSEWALEARLRLARAYRMVNRGTSYDADALRRSAAEYSAYIELVELDAGRAREYAALLAAARSELAEVREELALKLLEAADFYLRSGNAEAAQGELRNLVRDFPETEAAKDARTRLGRESTDEGESTDSAEGGTE